MSYAIPQLIAQPLSLGLNGRQPLDKAPDTLCKLVASIANKEISNGAPSIFHGSARFNELSLTGLDTDVPSKKLISDGFRLGTHVRRVSPQTGPIDAVLLRLSRLTPHSALGGVGRNAKLT